MLAKQRPNDSIVGDCSHALEWFQEDELTNRFMLSQIVVGLRCVKCGESRQTTFKQTEIEMARRMPDEADVLLRIWNGE